MSFKILVVEDHSDTREILRALLLHHGYEVHELTTAEDMLAQFERLAPDLVILDVRLPKMDGCEALEQLRARHIDTPVFIFSEFYDLFRERVQACRPNGFFPKSKGPMEMVRAIDALLSNKPPAA